MTIYYRRGWGGGTGDRLRGEEESLRRVEICTQNRVVCPQKGGCKLGRGSYNDEGSRYGGSRYSYAVGRGWRLFFAD